MRVLLIYDVPHDGTRQKVADACLDYGLERIQYSAFVGELNKTQQRSLWTRIGQRLGKQAGNVQLIPIDATSWTARRVLTQEVRGSG
jgi:CRISPR-associated protein Cas2